MTSRRNSNRSNVRMLVGVVAAGLLAGSLTGLDARYAPDASAAVPSVTLTAAAVEPGELADHPNVKVGAIRSLVATVTSSSPSGEPVTVSWTSSAPSVVSVAGDDTGAQLTGLSEGVATITVEASTVEGTSSDRVTVSVVDREFVAIPVASISAAATRWVDADSTAPQDGLAAVGAAISVEAISRSYFWVRPRPAASTDTGSWVRRDLVDIPATGITVTPSELTVKPRATAGLVATVTPALATDNVTWSTDNKIIAQTTSAGPLGRNAVLKGGQKGRATITASVAGLSDTVAVRVGDASSEVSEIGPDVTGGKYGRLRIQATPNGTDSIALNWFGDVEASRYKIHFRKKNVKPWKTKKVTTPASSLIIKHLEIDQRYEFKVTPIGGTSYGQSSKKTSAKTWTKKKKRKTLRKTRAALRAVLGTGLLPRNGSEYATSISNRLPYVKFRLVGTELQIFLFVRFVSASETSDTRNFPNSVDLAKQGLKSFLDKKALVGNVRDFAPGVVLTTKLTLIGDTDPSVAAGQNFLTYQFGGDPTCNDLFWFQACDVNLSAYGFRAEANPASTNIYLPWNDQLPPEKVHSALYGFDFAAMIAHETGHALGLWDAYTDGEANIDRMWENFETTTDFGGGNLENFMKYPYSGPPVTINDLEMIMVNYRGVSQRGDEWGWQTYCALTGAGFAVGGSSAIENHVDEVLNPIPGCLAPQ